MRTVSQKIYKFNELSPIVQRKAYQYWYDNEYWAEICDRTNDELKDIFEEFCKVYQIRFKKWEVDSEHYDYSIESFPTYNFDELKKIYKDNSSFKSTVYSDLDFLTVIKYYIEYNKPPKNIEGLILSAIDTIFADWQEILSNYKSRTFFKEEAKELEFYDNGSIYNDF